MARETGYAPSTIHRIWQAFSLQPHRSETFKLSADPYFVDKVRDIVGLYVDPKRNVTNCVMPPSDDGLRQFGAPDDKVLRHSYPITPSTTTIVRTIWCF